MQCLVKFSGYLIADELITEQIEFIVFGKNLRISDRLADSG